MKYLKVFRGLIFFLLSIWGPFFLYHILGNKIAWCDPPLFISCVLVGSIGCGVSLGCIIIDMSSNKKNKNGKKKPKEV